MSTNNNKKKIGVSKISLPYKYIDNKIAFTTKDDDGLVLVDVFKDEFISFHLDYYPDTPNDKLNDIIWSWQDGNALVDNVGTTEGTVRNASLRSFKIPDRLCGGVKYTILARLAGQPVSMAQKIKIRRSLPGNKVKIVGCQWSMKDRDKKNKTIISPDTRIKFGSVVTLSLETIGLNGSKVNICIYVRDNRIQLTKINVLCVNGILEVELDSGSWKTYIYKALLVPDNESVTYEVEYLDETKINDVSRRGPLLFSPDRNINAYDQEATNSITKSTVSQNEVKIEEFSSCRFDLISLSRKGSEDFIIFDKDKNIKPKMAINRLYTSETFVHFGFNKWDLESEFLPRLDAIAEYLHLNTTVSVKVEGHTDIRGKEGYNFDLGTNRANTVSDYLVEKGKINKNRVTSISYGKRELINKGEDVSEVEHEENRRCKITFEMNETMNDIVFYNLVSATETNPIDYTLNVDGYTNKGCLKADDENYAHTTELKINEYEKVYLKEKELNQIPYTFCAKKVILTDAMFDQVISWGTYYRKLERFLHDSVKQYNIDVHSCAFFSDIAKPSFKIMIFPDTLLTYDFRYNFDGGYETIREDLSDKIKLIRGDRGLLKFNHYLEQKIDGFFNKFSIGRIKIVNFEFIKNYKNIIIDFLSQELSKFEYGIHTFQDFLEKDSPVISNDETKNREHWVCTRIEGYYMGIVFVNVLVLILTRGKGAFSEKASRNIGKIERSKKKLKYFKAKISDQYDLEFSDLGIAESSTVGYEQMADGGVDYIYRYKVKADPLLAVDFKYIDVGTDKAIKEAMYDPSAEKIRDDDFHSLKDKIMDSSLKKILKDGMSFELTISGGFKFQYEVAYNYTQDTLLFYDVSANRTFPASQRDFDFESFIKIKIEIAVRTEYKLEWIFLNNSLTTQFEGDAELSSSIIYKKRFITIPDPIDGEVRPQEQSILQFTGIKYKYYQKVTVENGKGDTYYDSNPDEEPGIPQEPVEGILMDPYEQIIKTEYL